MAKTQLQFQWQIKTKTSKQTTSQMFNGFPNDIEKLLHNAVENKEIPGDSVRWLCKLHAALIMLTYCVHAGTSTMLMFRR